MEAGLSILLVGDRGFEPHTLIFNINVLPCDVILINHHIAGKVRKNVISFKLIPHF